MSYYLHYGQLGAFCRTQMVIAMKKNVALFFGKIFKPVHEMLVLRPVQRLEMLTVLKHLVIRTLNQLQ